MEARIVDQVIEEGNIGRGQPFKNVSSAKGHPKPQALRPGTGKKGPTRKPFRVSGVVKVELPHIADVFDVIEEDGDHAPGEIKKFNPTVADEGGQRQVSGKCFSSEATDDDLFVCGGHGAPGLSHGRGPEQRKRCRPGSQYANVVLHLRFVPTCQDLDKHLTRLSLHAVLGRVECTGSTGLE
jgi:hypothetical protein